MLRVEESILIKRPVDSVFAYLADAGNWVYWTSEVLEAKQTSAGEFGVGTTFQGIDRIMGFRVSWTSIISEYEPNKKFSHVLTSGKNLVEQHLNFATVEGGTNFTFAYVLKSSGMPSFVNPILITIMRRGIRRNLRKLKVILES